MYKPLITVTLALSVLLAGCGGTSESKSEPLVKERPAAITQYYDLAEQYNTLDDEWGTTPDDKLRAKYVKLATDLRNLDLKSSAKLAKACDILADPKGDPSDAVSYAESARKLAADDK